MKTDDELIEGYERGDEASLSLLIGRYLTPLYNFAFRVVGKREDAEDIVQETFMKAWKHLGRFRKGANFKTWLFSIARNTAIDHLRKKRPLSFSAFEGEEEGADYEQMIPDSTKLPDELAEMRLTAEFLERALDALPPIYREIIVLHYQEEMTLEESAEAIGIPLNTAKSRDRRALIALRKLLAKTAP